MCFIKVLRKQQQYTCFKGRWNKVLIHLTLFRASRKPKDLHKIRVEIKKYMPV